MHHHTHHVGSGARHWRVFYTFPRAEKKAEERLQELQIKVLLPKCVVVRQWKDRKKKVTEPLFRNYIFACVDELERLRVLQTQGIVRCVAFGQHLAEISEEEIEQLKIAQNDPRRLALGHWVPEIGKHVTVVEGPLRGLSGEVLEHRGQTYVIVRIYAIRQAVKINVPSAWLRASEESNSTQHVACAAS